MAMPESLMRLARRLTASPIVALFIAVALMAAALALAIQNDRYGKAERLRQASVQAQILASSLAAPLAFNDDSATREYLNAFRNDATIQAVFGVRAGGTDPAQSDVPNANSGSICTLDDVVINSGFMPVC